MKIEVKGIKYFSSMSDETNCFQATLYVDGKKVATCENQGCGEIQIFVPYQDRKIN